MFVKLWMKTNVITVNPEQTLAEALALMQQNRFRRLIVTKDQIVVGIISQEDILKGIPTSGDTNTKLIAAQSKVEAYMTHNPITADPMAPLEDIAMTMRRNKIGGIPILADGILVGIITESDIFHALATILGAGKKGARIELKTRHNPEDICKIVKLCKQFNIAIIAISSYHDFSADDQLLTIRLDGDEMDALIDALWQSGCQINRILRFEEGG